MGSGAACYDKPRCQLSGKKCLEGHACQVELTENRRAFTVRIQFVEGEAAFTAVPLEGAGIAEQVDTVRWHAGCGGLIQQAGSIPTLQP